MAEVTINIKTTADTSGVKKTTEALGGLPKSLKGVADMLGNVGAAAGMLGGLTAIGKVAWNSAKAFDQSAKMGAKLEAVLKSTGGAAGQSLYSLEKYASVMSKQTGIDDDLIKSTQAVMLTFTKIGGETFPQAMKAAADMSAVLGTDLQGSVIQVGKALNDFQGFSALKRAGVSFSQEQLTQIENFKKTNNLAGYQSLILKELGIEFGGASDAMHEAGLGFDNLQVAFDNLQESFGGFVSGGNGGWMEDMNRGFEYTFDWLGGLMDKSREAAEMRGKDTATWDRYFKALKPPDDAYDGFERFHAQLDKGREATKFYTQMAAAMNTTVQETVPTFEELEDQAQKSLEGGLKLTAMNEKLTEVNYQVNTSLEEQTAVLEELREKGYAETSQKMQEQIAVVNDLRVQSVQATQAQADAQEQYALKILETSGATKQQMLDFAVASGQITQGSANQQMAQEKLAEAFVSGGISAETYAAEVAYLMEKVKGMDGMHANSYIDVWIREHGDAAMLATVTSEAQTQTGGTAGQHGGAIGDDASYATGGQLGSGWALVGDRPGGIFVPGVSELVSPTGYVYDSKTSEMLLKSGFVGGTRSLALSGDLMGVGGGSVTKRPSPKVSTANRAGSRSGNTLASIALASSEATQEQQAQQQAQAMAQMQDEFTAAMRIQQSTLNNKLDELIGVMTGANPRAIGAEVGYQLAKAS